MSHPPGYVQNPYAMEISAAQRASLEAQESAERPARTSISSLLSGGDDFGANASTGQGAGVAGVWSTVKGLASTAGQKLGELEESAWKMANKKS